MWPNIATSLLSPLIVMELLNFHNLSALIKLSKNENNCPFTCKEEKLCKCSLPYSEGWIVLSSLDLGLMCVCVDGLGLGGRVVCTNGGEELVESAHKEKIAPTQVGKEPAHTRRGGTDQMRIAAPYHLSKKQPFHSGKNPFRFLRLGMGSGHWVFNYFSFIKPTPFA